jgi:peptidoglycan/LPS O-acetylase OafA/YrhL
MGEVNRFGNNFDFLRLTGALMVIFYTCFGVLGAHFQDPFVRLTNGVFTTGSLGVTIFFIISGYLITKSWDKRRDVIRFIWARFLRLVPALVGVALFTIFIIGPLVTHENIRDYFTSRLTWGYFSIISVFFQSYNLPGVFTGNFTDRVNGALWTLPVESMMYLVILAVGALGIIYKKQFVTLVGLSMLGIYLYANIHFIHVAAPLMPHNSIDLLKVLLTPNQPFFFLIGSLYYLNQDKIKYDLRLVVLAAIVWVLTLVNADLLMLSSFLCLPYIVLGIAFMRIPYINKIGKKADISYGLYIYHYPVQQTIVHFFQLSPLTLLIATLTVTVPLAWMSWKLIESKALSLKNIDFKIFKRKQITYAR